jgi:predicted transcriptional regulator
MLWGRDKLPEEEWMAGHILLLSIRPEYAAKIFDGSKKVELRRVKPKVAAGDSVLVYVSTPVRAMVGAFNVVGVMEGRPQVLWDRVKETAGITREQFDSYYRGATTAYGIVVGQVRHLPEPVMLYRLRELFAGFRPPQSYRYLNQKEAAAISLKSHEIMKNYMLQKMPASVR